MAHEMRMEKFAEFNPQPNQWRNNTRNYKNATESLEVIVAKNFSTLALPTVAIFPEIDKKGGYLGVKVAAPTGPLKDFFEQEDTKQVMFELMRDAVVDALAKKEAKRAGDNVEASTSVGNTLEILKPPRPIWDLNLKEIGIYFSDLKSAIAKYYNIKMKPKWPKLVDGVVIELPTKLPEFDEVVEKILPSYSYISQKKFMLGNLHWRLKLVCAYLLMQHDMDPNTYAKSVPENYDGKNFTVEDLRTFSDDIKKSARDHDKKVIKRKASEQVYNLDVEVNDEASDDESLLAAAAARKTYSCPAEESRKKQSQVDVESGPKSPTTPGTPSPPATRLPPPGPMTSSGCPDGSVQVVVAVHNDFDPLYDMNEEEALFNLSNDTGTPEDSFSKADSEDEFLAAIENAGQEDDCFKFRRMMKNTNIMEILAGKNDGCEQPILQVFNFDILGKGKAYRAHEHDGKVSTTKFAFTVDMNEQVEKLVGHKPILKVEHFKLYNGSFMVVTEFTVIQMLDIAIDTPEYLTEAEYEGFKAANKQTHKNLPQTPTLVSKNLTKSHINKMDVSATRSASQRLKHRSKGSNL